MWGCLLFIVASFTAARAQDVLGTATIYYDSSSNTMSASCVMDPSYDMLAFYGDPETICTIYPGGNAELAIQDIEWPGTEADIPDFTPDPDLNYIGYGDFLIQMLDSASEYFDGYYWSYYDPYFFDYYGEYPVYSGDPSYDWYGVDDQDFEEVGPLLYLGEVTADPVTTPAGPADHVAVVVDQGGYPMACPTTGIYVRQMQMQVVDANGVAINTNTSVVESYNTQPTNTCTGTQIPGSGACAATGAGSSGTGQFIDTMLVSTNLCGSGIPQSSSCGFSLTSTWSACSNGLTNQLWQSSRTTQANGVTVSGNSTGYLAGTEFH
jgi:hypothetical protein